MVYKYASPHWEFARRFIETAFWSNRLWWLQLRCDDPQVISKVIVEMTDAMVGQDCELVCHSIGGQFDFGSAGRGYYFDLTAVPRAVIMRAVAERFTPSTVNWDVVEQAGGDCFFVITRMHRS